MSMGVLSLRALCADAIAGGGTARAINFEIPMTLGGVQVATLNGMASISVPGGAATYNSSLMGSGRNLSAGRDSIAQSTSSLARP